jgi:hypothetical protein
MDLDNEIAKAETVLKALREQKAKAVQAEHDAFCNKMDRLIGGMPMGRFIIDCIAPQHGRTSCSDTNRINGLDSAGYGCRCLRCALLEIAEQRYWPREYTISVEIKKAEDHRRGGRGSNV